MGVSSYQVRKCERAECGLRYPSLVENALGEACPRCGGPTHLVFTRERLGDSLPYQGMISDSMSLSVGSPSLEGLFDNIRSAWNVGSMFRSAEGAGFNRLYLCGITPTPQYPGVLKTSLGAEKVVPWTQSNDGVMLVQELRAQGVRLWALETDAHAEVLYEVKIPTDSTTLVLVVGNENCGIDPELHAQCERTLYIPMRGMKRSFNVAVAFGIAAHYLAWAVSQVSRPSPTDL